MIGQRYREKKTAVLDVWTRYRSFRGNSEDGVDPAFLELRAKALEAGRYVLAVVGETKAGKSTLINALLGERILPTDVLQSSSAIVEIFKSEKKYVEVRYADGHAETVHDDLATPDVDEAFEHLRRIGALQDRFRTIPTTLIDAGIVQGRIKAGRPIPFADLQAVSKLPLAGKEALIEEYVRGRTLAHIPVEITFGFPLKYAFDELRLVDSPGVNALGGVQDRTFAYLHNANAVLFVHSLEGPVEKSSFREFITQVVPNRTRQALFLVLSKSGFKSDIEIDEKVSEARSLFSEEFDHHRVLHVDSMLKIVADELDTFDSAAALKAHYVDRKKHFEQRYQGERRQEWRDEAVNFDTKLKLLNNTLEALGNGSDRDAVRAALRRSSNFEQMEQAIEEFSAQAPELQLSELLVAVERGYENQVAAHAQNIDLLTKKRKHPQTFENEISEIQRLLKEYQRELNEFTESVHRKHTGVNAENRAELQRLKAMYESTVGQAHSEASVRKALVDFNDECGRLVDQVAGSIKHSFADRLKQLGAEFKAKHGVTIPTVDVAGIAEQAKQDAYRTERVKVGSDRGDAAAGGGVGGAILGGVIGFFLGGPVGAAIGAGVGGAGGAGAGYAAGDDKYEERKVFDSSKYIANLRSLAVATVQKVTETTVPSILSEFVDKHTASFKTAVGTLMTARRDALEQIRTKKAANDEILREIAAEEQKKKDIGAQVSLIHEMLEDLR